MIAPSRQITSLQDLTLRLQPGNRPQQLMAEIEPGDGPWLGLPDRFEVYLPLERWELDEALANVSYRQQTRKIAAVSRGVGDPVIGVGERLFSALIDRTPLSKIYQENRSANVGTRLRLVMDDPAVAAIPWELMFDPYRSDFLALSDSLPIVVRQWQMTNPPEPLAPPVLQVLVLVAEVVEMDAEGEIQELQRIAANSQHLELSIHRDVSQSQFFERIKDESFHVLHFIGTGVEDNSPNGNAWGNPDAYQYGRSSGYGGRTPQQEPAQRLVLMPDESSGPQISPNWQEQSIDADTIASALAQKEDLQLLFLSGCDSNVLARELSAKAVPQTLGIRGTVSSAACTALARGFYSALVQGAPLEVAVTQARQMVDRTLPGSREWGLAQLYMRSPEGLRIDPSASTPDESTTDGPRRPTRGETATPQDRRLWRLQQMLRIQKENRDALTRRAASYGKNVPSYIQKQIDDIEKRIAELEEEIAGLG